jgi:hypothetical protein
MLQVSSDHRPVRGGKTVGEQDWFTAHQSVRPLGPASR